MSKEIQVRRAKRRDLTDIAALVCQTTDAEIEVDKATVTEWLFSKGLWVATEGDTLVGVAAWQAENLLSVTDVFHVSPTKLRTGIGTRLLETIEAEADTLMCEANIVLIPVRAAEALHTFLQDQGYEAKEFDELHRIWREVLSDFAAQDSDLMVKRLRDRMVMVPI